MHHYDLRRGCENFTLRFLGLLGLSGFVGLVLSAPYRIKRITSYLNPWGPFGERLSNHSVSLCGGARRAVRPRPRPEQAKFFYLPEPQTDFIFAILSEELGFIGGSLILLLFSVLLWRGIRIALGAPDLYGSFVAVGVISMIAIQVMINIGVVTGLIPVTGITLPFLSYGGSSLTLMLMAVGVLLNVSRYSRY